MIHPVLHTLFLGYTIYNLLLISLEPIDIKWQNQNRNNRNNNKKKIRVDETKLNYHFQKKKTDKIGQASQMILLIEIGLD